MSTATDYWAEAIACSCDAHGIDLTPGEISALAEDIATAHENYGMAFPNPGATHLLREIQDLKQRVVVEREKVVCPACKGRGTITEVFGPIGRSSTSRCDRCRGEGKVSP